MLGRLRMPIQKCKEAYLNLATEAFTPKNFVSRAMGASKLGPKYKTAPLEAKIKSIIGAEWETMLLRDDDPQCKVSVIHTQFLAIFLKQPTLS